MSEHELKRMPRARQAPPQMVPQSVPGESDLVRVDTTWGQLQPMQVAEGIRTVGELEVLERLRQGEPVVDNRSAGSHAQATLPGALNIPHAEATDRRGELDRSRVTVFFCNGPQCPQSPTAIRALLDGGFPADRIIYYRGGMHDWVTLGLPTVPGE